jgi:hypothetical protein
MKVAALRALDSVSLVICGLCLTQKAVDIIRKKLIRRVIRTGCDCFSGYSSGHLEKRRNKQCEFELIC